MVFPQFIPRDPRWGFLFSFENILQLSSFSVEVYGLFFEKMSIELFNMRVFSQPVGWLSSKVLYLSDKYAFISFPFAGHSLSSRSELRPWPTPLCNQTTNTNKVRRHQCTRNSRATHRRAMTSTRENSSNTVGSPGNTCARIDWRGSVPRYY